MINKHKIAIIGLGYVGLPLAVIFSRKYKIIGFDINNERVDQLKQGKDINNEVLSSDIISQSIIYTSNLKRVKSCNIFIITVPTPLGNNKKPDLSILFETTKMIASCLCRNDIVIYESTVYPGVTEEECVPILEEISKLVYNKDFFCGYSPERISPGQNQKKIEDIVKLVSGSNSKTTTLIDKLYKSVIQEGTYRTSSIKIAEASKLVENTQRDVNIALINELAMMFDMMNINSSEVFEAAETKWNFIEYKPGLVGGHCIGVDPYYLTYKSEKIGFKPTLILNSRQINNSIPFFIVDKTIKFLVKYNKPIKNATILILGYTFKEDCSDTRNTKIKVIIEGLEEYCCKIYVYDPLIRKNHTNFIKNPFNQDKKYDAIIVAVSHQDFFKYKKRDYEKISNGKLILLDIKGIVKNATWKF